MPRDDSAPDRLWALIEARKEARKDDRNDGADGARNGAQNGHALSDAPLVDMLYRMVNAPEADTGLEGGAARSMLHASILADSASRQFRRTRWLPTRHLTGTRQVLAAVALLLITVAAIAYTIWSTRRLECTDYSSKAAVTSLPSPVLPVSATPPAEIGSMGSAKSLSGVKHLKPGIKGAKATEVPCKP